MQEKSCHENTHEKSFQTSPPMIYLALFVKILKVLAKDHWDRVIGP